MPRLLNELELDRCPHCNVDKPRLVMVANVETNGHSGQNQRFWRIYKCGTCGGLVTAASNQGSDNEVTELYPSATTVDESIPTTAKNYLTQALNCIHAPAGAVMLAASAVDSMLKAKNYTEGSLYARIEQATADHLITADMKQWAHDIRLDANDQRHADL